MSFKYNLDYRQVDILEKALVEALILIDSECNDDWYEKRKSLIKLVSKKYWEAFENRLKTL